MSHTRRAFFQSATLAAGLAGAVPSAAAQSPARADLPGQAPPSAAPLRPASEIQVPKVKFGDVEISRLVLGCNPIYGISHFNKILSSLTNEYYTPDRVCSVLHQCNRFGINTFNTVVKAPILYEPANWVPPAPALSRTRSDLDRFESEGGKMNLIIIVQEGPGRIVHPGSDPASIAKAFKPLAMYYVGEASDRAYQTDTMNDIREWCKKARDTGVKVGVGAHMPEVIEMVEEQGWDIDFYFACVYKRTRTPGEFRKMFSGELPVDDREIYLAEDPPRMYKVIRQTKKHCFAFKILAAGRISDDAAKVDHAFQLAYESIKPTDCVCVGMFPKYRDQVRENAERVVRILSRGGAPTSAA